MSFGRLEMFNLKFGEHIITHMDAPSHFAKDKITIDEIPMRNFHGPGMCIVYIYMWHKSRLCLAIKKLADLLVRFVV